jgi:hypothetical protein
MTSVLVDYLASCDNKVFLGPNPIVSLLYEAKSNNQIRVEDPLPPTHYWLFMLENELNADCLLVVVLILIDRRVVAILVSERASTVTDPYLTPAQTFRDLAVLRRERYRSANKVLADVADLCNLGMTLLNFDRRSQRNPR